MKFLCDNCKAKYQIADEKVAGKTVRMKCRKCGHQIEVRAAVTETSVSTSPPSALGSSGSEAPRAIAKGGLATSLSAAKPRAPMGQAQAPAASALAGAFQRNVQDGPQSAPFGQGGSPIELSVTDEWYVAINGVPVGPVRLSELRRKAASGAVTEDSLCWQEGLEEWRPVRSIPELAAIVREAAQGNRPSLVSPPVNEGRASSPPRPPVAQPPQAPRPSSPSRSPEPPRPAAPMFESRPQGPSRSNVVPLRVAANELRNIEDAPPITAPLSGGAGGAAAFAPAFAPHAVPSFAPPHVQAAPHPPSAPLAISDPFAVPPGPSAPSASFLAAPPPYAASQPSMQSIASIGSFAPAPPQQKRGVPLWFWPVLLFTGVFGVSAAVVVFRQPPQQARGVLPTPPTTPTTTTTAEARNDVPSPPPAAEPTTSASAPAGKVAVATGPKSGGVTAAPVPEKKGIDLGGLVPGAGGPNVGGGSGASAAGGGGLDSTSIERVVASHRTGVKRTCWERGGADQKSSVNVLVSATVAPDGSVAGTSSSGDDPVVGKCIESQVRTWKFNAPGSTTTVNIPFKFVRQ